MFSAAVAGSAGARKRAAARAVVGGGAELTTDAVKYRMRKRSDVRQVAKNDPSMLELNWDVKTSVGLAGSGAREEDLVSLAEAMINNTHLQRISLRSIKVFGAGKAKLLKSMKKCNVCHVDLTDAGVNDKDKAKFRKVYMEYALERLAKNDPALLELNWPASRMSDDDMPALAKALSKNTSLLHLNLYGNQATKSFPVGVTSAGVKHLIAVVPMTGLCSIDLRLTDVSQPELDQINSLCLINDAKLEALEPIDPQSIVDGEVRPEGSAAEDGAVQRTGIVEEGEPPEPEPAPEPAPEPEPETT